MSKYKKLFANTIWFAISNISSRAALFLLLPVYTIYLTDIEFGIYELVLTATFFLIPLFTLQIAQSLVRFALDSKEDVEEIFSCTIIFTGIGIAVSVLFYPLISLYEPIGEYSIYFYLLLVLRIIYTILQNFLKTIDKISVLSIAGFIESLMIVLLSFLLIVYYEMALKGLFITLLASIGLSVIIILFLSKPFNYFKAEKFSLKKSKELIKFSLPLMPNSMSGWFMNLSNRYFIEYFLGVASTGMFSIAARIPVIFQTVYTTFYNAWIISAFENYDKDDRKFFFSTVHEILFLGVTAGVSFTLLLMKPIMSILVTAEFYEAWRYIPFLLLGNIFFCMTSYYGVLYIAEKKTSLVLYTTVTGSVLSVALNIILIPLWGINGASISFAASFLVVWIIRIIQTNRFFPIGTSYFKMALSTMLVGAQIWVAYNAVELEIPLHLFIIILLLGINYKTIQMILLHGKNLYNILIKKVKVKLNNGQKTG